MKSILLIPAINILNRKIEPYIPYGLFSLQAAVSKCNVEVDVFDMFSVRTDFEFKSSEGLLNHILSKINFSKYDMIGLSCICNSFHYSLRIAKYVKSIFPHKLVLLGGPHASIIPQDIIKTYSFVDGIVVGEGEKTFYELVSEYCKDDNCMPSIPGLISRERSLTPRDNFMNMDDLPFIGDSNGFLKVYQLAGDYNFPNSIPLEVSRGCTGRCKFCSTKLTWGSNVRRKSNNKIYDEMNRLVRLTNKSSFMFIGDNFGIPRSKLFEFCNYLISHNNKLFWNCNLKSDCINVNNLDLLWRAGCRGLFIGVESASQYTLNMIKKDISIKHTIKLIEEAIKIGFLIEASLIIGFPWENERAINETYELHHKLLQSGAFRSQIWVLCPLPGTELAQEYANIIDYNHIISRIAIDDIELDELTKDIISKNRSLFTQFGYYVNRNVDWMQISATADAAHQLSSLYNSV